MYICINVEEVKAGIRDQFEKSQDMLSVGEQRELYFQLLVLQNFKDDDLQSKMPPLREITNDLEKWRREVLGNRYTPGRSIVTPNMDVTRTSNKSRNVTEHSL